jgi:uncharacterized membrane protein
MNRTRDRAISETDVWLPVIAGSALMAYGIGQRSRIGTALAVLGGGMVFGGTKRLVAPKEGEPLEGFRVEKSVTIARSAEELYQFWRNFEQLPAIMRHLESVERTGENTWRWTARAPAGQTVSWDAEITMEMPDRLIAWRSLEGSTVWHQGAVEFLRATGGRGTVVKVSMKYDPPAGALGKAVARLFREEPSQQVAEDLRRFKQLMEAGEISTTEGQPSGRE